MRPSLAILSFGTSLAAAATNSSIICSNSIYQPFMSLTAYAPAESFCSRLYPIAPVTSTITAPTITSTIRANWTLSITITATPLTDTITVEPTTATTSLDPVTTTTTIDTTVTETAPPTTVFTTTTLTETSTDFTTETVTATTQSPQKRDAKYPPLATSEPKPSKKKCHRKSKSSTPAVETYTAATNAPSTTTYPGTNYPVAGNATFTTYPVPGNATATDYPVSGPPAVTTYPVSSHPAVTTYPVSGHPAVTTYPVPGNASFTTYPAGTNATSTITSGIASSSAPPVGDCASGDALCSLFSSLTKRAPTVISTACSCIETAEITTVTTTPRATFFSTPLASVTTTPTETSSVIPTVTETVTPTATASETDTSTVTETPTTTVTITTTTTTTTTSTATTTVEAWCAASAGRSTGTNTCKCAYDVACETSFTSSPVVSISAASVAACQYQCDMYLNCLAYRYVHASNSCGLYTTRGGSEVAAPGYVAAPRVKGTCSNSACTAYD
ncbi:hypothetical protein F4775DRAFT_551611 [Biscogniauxia sp. FL1348]|nr:hypothetical protein F4775DRAFT_551611 [Biscogniauxia sp. FL1348]